MCSSKSLHFDLSQFPKSFLLHATSEISVSSQPPSGCENSLPGSHPVNLQLESRPRSRINFHTGFMVSSLWILPLQYNPQIPAVLKTSSDLSLFLEKITLYLYFLDSLSLSYGLENYLKVLIAIRSQESQVHHLCFKNKI